MEKLSLGKKADILVESLIYFYSFTMKFKFIIKAGFLCFISLSLLAEELTVGSDAPAFSLLDENGEKWNSTDFIGKKNILIFFYPAAMTGGCTKQACSYRDDLADWKSKGFEIVGISGDKPQNLKLFKKVENLNFKLLSDTDGAVARSFGVPQSKGGSIQKFVQGERFTLDRGVTTKRWTFIISKQGKILYKNEKVNAAQDSQDALRFISKL